MRYRFPVRYISWLRDKGVSIFGFTRSTSVLFFSSRITIVDRTSYLSIRKLEQQRALSSLRTGQFRPCLFFLSRKQGFLIERRQKATSSPIQPGSPCFIVASIILSPTFFFLHLLSPDPPQCLVHVRYHLHLPHPPQGNAKLFPGFLPFLSDNS